MPLARPIDQATWSMFVAAHRAHAPRRRRRAARDRVLVFAADPEVRLWIEHELFGERLTMLVVESLAEVVGSLTLVPPPWPQILVVDTAAIAPADVEVLGAIRHAGWCGHVIAIGEVSDAIHRSLDIDRIVPRTLRCEVLRSALQQLGGERPTIPMRRVVR